MTEGWITSETTTHQDHVIAHVLEKTVLGYIVINETVFLLLDIGFLWHVYVDGEMGLLPHPVAVAEMDVSEELRSELKDEIELLLRNDSGARSLNQFSAFSHNCVISAVDIYSQEDRRKLVIKCQSATVELEMSLTSGEIQVREISGSE